MLVLWLLLLDLCPLRLLVFLLLLLILLPPPAALSSSYSLCMLAIDSSSAHFVSDLLLVPAHYGTLPTYLQQAYSSACAATETSRAALLPLTTCVCFLCSVWT